MEVECACTRSLARHWPPTTAHLDVSRVVPTALNHKKMPAADEWPPGVHPAFAADVQESREL